MRISDWSSDVCSSDLDPPVGVGADVEAVIIIEGGAAILQLGPNAAAVAQQQVDAVLAEQGGAGDGLGLDAVGAAALGPFDLGCIRRGLADTHRNADDDLTSDRHLRELQRFMGAEDGLAAAPVRSEEHTSELQSLMRISYAVLCLK